MIKVQIQIKSEKLGKGGSLSPLKIAKEMITNGKGLKQFYKADDFQRSYY